MNYNNGLLGFHVVLTTHNSRTSNRMSIYKIERGDALLLTLQEEIELSIIIGKIITENNYRCVAYNICQDHVHLIIVCHEFELSRIVQKIKSISSKIFQRSNIAKTRNWSKQKYHLWSQKFFRAYLNEWQLARLSIRPGEVYESDHLMNSINYIQNNRIKHQLEYSKKLDEIIQSIRNSFGFGLCND